MKKIWINRFIAIACASMLTACANGPKGLGTDTPPRIELSVLMDNATLEEKGNQKEAALLQYAEAAKLYPASFQPWLKIAQIKFESSNYGEAITAAQQVISRDERNQVANSILAVSGLRVSTKALAELRHQSELTGSVRDEAQDLAKVLRDSLGERILVPVAAAAPPPPAPRTARARVASKPAEKKVIPLASNEGGSSSPFGALK